MRQFRLFCWLLLLVAAWCKPLHGQSVTIRIATIVPEGSSWVKCLRNIDQECRRKMNVRFIIYAGGTAGENKAVQEKIKYGQLDGAGFAAVALSNMSSQLRIMEIPYLYRSMAEWKHIFRKIRKGVEADIKKADYVVLGWAYAGFAYIYSRDPVRNLEDFRKTKPWIYPGDPLMESCFRELEVSGVPLGTSGVLPALQTGLVNCVYNSPYGLLAVQWHTSVRYCTDLPIANPIGAVIITRRVYEKIPSRYRRLFLRICRHHFGKLARNISQDNKEAAAELKNKYHIQMVAPDPKWAQQTEKFAEKIATEQIGKLYSAEFLQNVLQWQKQFRAKK